MEDDSSQNISKTTCCARGPRINALLYGVATTGAISVITGRTLIEDVVNMTYAKKR